VYCPYCSVEETKVIDSRLVNDGSKVRRRRECIRCAERFTTYESIEWVLPRIIKRDGTHSAFNENKLRAGILKALEKRPISVEQIDAVVQCIIHCLRSGGEREVSSQYIGELVMKELRSLDEVAYVRFASVYRSFQDVNAFHEEIRRLQNQESNESAV